MALLLSGRIHKEKLAAHSFGTHLLKNAPSVFRATVHNIAELLPLLLGLYASVFTPPALAGGAGMS